MAHLDIDALGAEREVQRVTIRRTEYRAMTASTMKLGDSIRFGELQRVMSAAHAGDIFGEIFAANVEAVKFTLPEMTEEIAEDLEQWEIEAVLVFFRGRQPDSKPSSKASSGKKGPKPKQGSKTQPSGAK